MEDLLVFFGCATVTGWTESWKNSVAAYRKSPKLQSKPEALAAWLRKAEIEGRKQLCVPYDEAAFTKALERLKKVTTQPVCEWAAMIRQECKHGGKMPVSSGHELARKLGISGSIVAGRLQFDRIWERFVGNDTKQRYAIEELVPDEVTA